MKFIISIAIAMIVFPLLASSGKTNSVTLSTDSIEYEGHRLSGQSFSFNTDLNKNYGYEISLQHINDFSINQQDGKLNVNHSLEINNIGLGLYRVLKLGNFYARPFIGFIHTSVNLNTKYRYDDELRAFGEALPISLTYETFNSKSAFIPSYGLRIGYRLTDVIGLFMDVRKQGYNLKQIGVEITF